MADDSHNDEELQELARAVRELSERVRRLEQRLDVPADTSVPPTLTGTEVRSGSSALESRIGAQWLNRIGVVAMLFGVAYLLRYAFARAWISATAWISLGVAAGIVIILGSEWFRRRDYRVLSLSLKATGVGVSYLSLWAGLELYRVLSGPEAFAGLVLVTALAAALALREHSQPLAALALTCAFLTPLLISIPARQGPLFFYLTIVDCASAVVILRRGWWKLLTLSFAGTVLLSGIWGLEHYRPADQLAAVAAATVLFAVLSAMTTWFRTSPPPSARRLIAVLALLIPAAYFSALYLVLSPASPKAPAVPAFALATLYFALAWVTQRTGLVGVYGALGIGLVAIALAILLPLEWLSLGWFTQAAALVALGFWRDLPWLRWGGLLLLCAAVLKAFAFDVWQLRLGYRTISFIALGALLLAMSYAYQRYGLAIMLKTGKRSRQQP